MTYHVVLTVLANLLLGLGLGAAGGLLGIGGGLIAIPILGALYGMDQHLAQGTALVMIAPNVLIGFWRYHQRHPVHLARTPPGMRAGVHATGHRGDTQLCMHVLISHIPETWPGGPRGCPPPGATPVH